MKNHQIDEFHQKFHRKNDDFSKLPYGDDFAIINFDENFIIFDENFIILMRIHHFLMIIDHQKRVTLSPMIIRSHQEVV